MLRLDIAVGPRWIDLGIGVEVEVLPLGSSLMARVWQDKAFVPDDADGALSGIVNTKAIARHAIVGWRGVGDADGNPVEPTAEYIDALMEIPACLAAFQRLYVVTGMQVLAEGNGSAASPNGSSAEAATIAHPASAPVQTARGGSTPRKPSRGDRSGT